MIAHMRYTPSPGRNILFLLFMIACVVAGIKLQDTPALLRYSAMIFGSLGALVFVVQLLPGSNFLELDEKVLRYRSLYRDHEMPWTALESFIPVPMNDGKTVRVGFRFIPEAFADGAAGDSGNPSQAHGILPDNYGMKAEELVEILNARLAEKRS